MKEIQLTQGKTALVDDADYLYINQFKWFAKQHTKGGVWYATRGRRVSGKRVEDKMETFIIQVPNGMIIDHKDGNGLNNKKDNLRASTRSENARNCKTYGRSKYTCVSWSETHQVWVVRVTMDGKRKFIGTFKNELEAAIIANISMRKYYGKFARLNELANQ